MAKDFSNKGNYFVSCLVGNQFLEVHGTTGGVDIMLEGHSCVLQSEAGYTVAPRNPRQAGEAGTPSLSSKLTACGEGKCPAAAVAAASELALVLFYDPA